MTNGFDVIEHAGNGQLNGVTMDLSSFSTVLHAIFAEGADYTKKSVESRLAVVEKLLGAKSLETVIQIQSEYAKTSYAAFVTQAAKMGELHSNLAKAVFKPAELAIRRDKGMQTEISPYDATGYRDEHERLALQRANIMHLVDLKRGGYSPRRTEMRIRLTGRPRSISILSKSAPPVA